MTVTGATAADLEVATEVVTEVATEVVTAVVMEAAMAAVMEVIVASSLAAKAALMSGAAVATGMEEAAVNLLLTMQTADTVVVTVGDTVVVMEAEAGL